MKIEIIDDNILPPTGNSRIEEIYDIIEVDTCFICNGKPSITRTIYPKTGKYPLQYFSLITIENKLHSCWGRNN